MGDDPKEPQVPPRARPDDGRVSVMPWLLVAALVLVVAGVAGCGLLDGGDDDGASTGADATDTADTEASGDDAVEESVTVLQPPAAGPGQARCAVPSPGILARQQLAFDGTVTQVADGEVTLEPAMFYAGEPTDLVVVKAPPAKLRDLLLTVDFEKGKRYLVAADRGRVSICGYSGPWSADLERLYLEAFPG